MLVRALRITVAAVISAVAIAYLLASCGFGDNVIVPSDALGPRNDINACCERWRPWNTDAPGECLDELAEPGVCRWLDCLLGIYSYRSEACP